MPRSGSNEQYQPIVLPGQIPTAEHSLPGGPRHKRAAALWCPSNVGYLRTGPAMDPMLDPPKVDDFRISQSDNKREKLEGPSNPVVLAVASKRRLRFNLSGLIRAL